MVYSPIEENYLKALYHLSQSAGSVSVNELSKHLLIKMPTVNSMMKKFSEKGLVIYESYKPLRLTKLGAITAALIIRKHRLTEMFLVEKMGFSWDEVHVIAEQIEHIQSPPFFDKMDALLNYPKFDPHGSPIPDKNGKISSQQNIKLAAMKIGEQAEIIAVLDSSPAFLKYLSSKNLILNQKVSILAIEDFDKSMEILLPDGVVLNISLLVADKLLVH